MPRDFVIPVSIQIDEYGIEHHTGMMFRNLPQFLNDFGPWTHVHP